MVTEPDHKRTMNTSPNIKSAKPMKVMKGVKKEENQKIINSLLLNLNTI